jgi:hypothetical protein
VQLSRPILRAPGSSAWQAVPEKDLKKLPQTWKISFRFKNYKPRPPACLAVLSKKQKK